MDMLQNDSRDRAGGHESGNNDLFSHQIDLAIDMFNPANP
jgi:hypothetical protein